MNPWRTGIGAALAMAISSGQAQESEVRPCIENPIQWERAAGQFAGADPPPSVLTGEGRDLGAVDVAALLASEEPKAYEATCTAPIERMFGDFNWLVSECEAGADLTIIRLLPGKDNSISVQFTVSLLGDRCGITWNLQLDREGERVRSALLNLTRQEIGELVEEIRSKARP